MDKTQLLEKIEKLEKRFSDPAYPEDVEEIKSWKGEVRRAMLGDNLKEHDAIKEIINHFQKEIEEMDLVLIHSYSDKLSDKARDRLLDRKEMYQQFLDFFPQDKDLEIIADKVDENIV